MAVDLPHTIRCLRRGWLEHYLEDTEEHAHWLESQLTLVEQVGLAPYLAEQLTPEG